MNTTSSRAARKAIIKKGRKVRPAKFANLGYPQEEGSAQGPLSPSNGRTHNITIRNSFGNPGCQVFFFLSLRGLSGVRTRSPVSQPLADDTLQRFLSSHIIIVAELHAMAVTEVELGKVAVLTCPDSSDHGLCKWCPRLRVFVAHRAACARFLYKSYPEPRSRLGRSPH
jgi:hypothetical protein